MNSQSAGYHLNLGRRDWLPCYFSILQVQN
jgi:hypothetical protein